MAQVVSGHTRGEYGRGLDLDSITDEQGFTFVCPKTENLLVLLKNDKKYAINGEVITEPAMSAQFYQHRFATRDKDVAAELRKSSPFKKGLIKELGDAKAAAKEAKVRAAIEAAKADPDLLKAIKGELLKDAKSEEPVVAAKRTNSKSK